MTNRAAEAVKEPGRCAGEFIDLLVHIGTRAAVAEFGADAERAKAVMRDVAFELGSLIGGGAIYIPNFANSKLVERDAQLFAEWRAGMSVCNLAVKHKISTARVYQLIGQMRKKARVGDAARAAGPLLLEQGSPSKQPVQATGRPILPLGTPATASSGS